MEMSAPHHMIMPNTVQAVLAHMPVDTPFMAEVTGVAAFIPENPGPLSLPPEPDAIAARFDAWRGSDITPIVPLLQAVPVQDAVCQMAATLGAVPTKLTFHNQHHVREVVCLAMLLAANADAVTRRDLFIAACIHDFGHDGQGNRRGARHTPMRLERRALDLAHPYLKAAGIDDATWARVTVMVLSTDVSKDGSDAVSPAEWLRRAVKNAPADGCPAALQPLFTDAKLAHACALLEDADLGTSAGLPYDHARRMTALISDETGVLAPTPQTLIGFLDHICHGAFITREAVELYGDNIPGLRARAVEETADTIYSWS